MSCVRTTLDGLFAHFSSSDNERQLGFVLIIDRRSDRWMSVKSIMSYIEVNDATVASDNSLTRQTISVDTHLPPVRLLSKNPLISIERRIKRSASRGLSTFLRLHDKVLTRAATSRLIVCNNLFAVLVHPWLITEVFSPRARAHMRKTYHRSFMP